MCGILGIINFKDLKINKDEFKKSLDLQEHRGPDDSGIINGEDFIFGHRRLSIIDLKSQSKQPMLSSCGNYILVYNGEIYNYQEIKKELISKKYVFKTDSDTEVLLNSFIEYGIDCVKQFIGMFAFSIFDKKNKVTYVVRDRLGIKPLYFEKDEDNFIFSSEIKSILKLSKNERELNINAVSSYLSFRYPILDDTFFKGINSLAPAHYIKITRDSFETFEYWNVCKKFDEQQEDKGEEFYISEINRILESAVKYRMISDVPFGAFLSGGVDSSVITAIMSKNSTDKIKTFTIGFNEKNYNEFKYANIVAKKYNTEHQEIILSGKDYINTMESLIEFKDAPLSVPNEVPLYLMSKELKKFITVVLSGEGADEIFGGYGRIFRSPYDYERIKEIDSLELSHEEKRHLSENFIKKYGTMIFQNEISHFMQIYSYTSFEDKRELLNNEIELYNIEKKLINKFMSYFDELKDKSYYNKIMYTFEKIHLVGLLHRVDMTTMATSVEARVPFVDHRLVELSFSIPIKYKLKWKSDSDKKESKILMSDKISENYDIPKYILKKAFEDKLPDEILYRKKVGFPVPLNSWFGGSFNKYAKRILLSKRAKGRMLYNNENIKKWLNDSSLLKEHDNAMKIWMLINLELFLKRYFDDNVIKI